MNNQQRTWDYAYTKEQREAWDKIDGKGLYEVTGKAPYTYLCNRLKNIANTLSDPHTIGGDWC